MGGKDSILALWLARSWWSPVTLPALISLPLPINVVIEGLMNQITATKASFVHCLAHDFCLHSLQNEFSFLLLPVFFF